MSWNVQGSMRGDGVPVAPGMLDGERSDHGAVVLDIPLAVASKEMVTKMLHQACVHIKGV